jgi:hypothetical protein
VCLATTEMTSATIENVASYPLPNLLSQLASAKLPENNLLLAITLDRRRISATGKHGR